MGIICDSYQIVYTFLTFMRNDVLPYYYVSVSMC